MKIELKELIPPIFFRVVRFIQKKIITLRGGVIRMHPFDSIPADVDVKWVLDVGANVGDVTFLALKSFPGCKVICIEPVSNTYEILTRRLEKNTNDTFLFNVAFSDLEGEGEINITNFHGANSIEPQANYHKDFNPHVRELSKESISLVRLDDFAKKFPSQKIDVMKIDVEGHELNVLKGGANFIAKNVDVIIIEIAMMRDETIRKQAVFEIFALLNNLGFCLLNVIDLHHIANKDMQLIQMDCVFRNKINIK